MKRKLLFYFACFLLSGTLVTSTYAQGGETAKGTVLDENNQPLIGATVSVDGTSNAALTNLDGAFELKGVKSGQSLTFKYLGYADQTVVYGGSALTVQMQPSATAADEVIVVGYMTTTRNANTGSVATVKAAKLNTQAAADVSSMLQGKAPGVNITSNSGSPDATPRIVIRGVGTLSSSSDPLWVVDGVVWNRDPRLSPSEIESLNILKDASATALYGSRGSNGVIVVTTNKGKAGTQTFNVNLKVGIRQLDMGNLKMMNSQQLYDYQNGVNQQSWFQPSLKDTDTDWFKESTQLGFYGNANFTYQGGTEKIQSYLLLDYYYENGAVKTKDFQRFTIRNNNDYKWAKNFTAFSRIQTQYETQKDQQIGLYGTYLALPWDKPYNEDGTIRTGTEEDWLGRDKSNPLYGNDLGFAKKQRVYVSANLGFKWNFTDWLAWESNNSAVMFLERAEEVYDPRLLGAQADNGTVYNWYQMRQEFFTNQMLRFSKTWGKHNVSALAAYEFSRSFNQVSTATAKGLTSGKEVIDGTTGMKTMTGYKEAYNIQSLLVNANYNYDSRYMFQASYRYDGSSKFGKNNQYGSFYTFSGAWNIANEKFFKPAKEIVSELKLRASWGIVGNTPDGAYSHYSLYTAGEYNGRPANFPSQLGNPDLTWEKNQTLDIGLEVGFINRIRLSVDYYDKYTSDLLYFARLSTVTGYTGQWRNIGSIRNTGWEFAIDADVISQNGWLWSVNANLSLNKNKIEGLYKGQAQEDGLMRRFEVGRDMNDMYIREWAGVDPANGDPLWYYTDADGNRKTTNQYNTANKVYVGSSSPKFYGGFGTSLSWKGISLLANFTYSVGGQVYNQNREVIDNDGAYLNYNSMNLAKGWSRWEKPGDIATHPKVIDGGNLNAVKESSRYVENTSFLTLRNITLSYDLSADNCKKIGLKGLRFSLSADNLFTTTDYSLVSPDAAMYHTGGNVGYAAWGLYPTTKSYVFGINVTF